MAERKVHLASGHGLFDTACGQSRIRRVTDDPTQVTCTRCTRTLAMAQAEITEPQRRKNLSNLRKGR